MPVPASPTTAEVDRIAALTDAVIRNYQITQSYHELSLVLAARTGQAANWCTFATWASRQAGQTIRKEDLARTLELLLGSDAAARQAAQELLAAARRLGAILSEEELLALLLKVYRPQEAFELSSQAVARGNVKVYAEIGREFARFFAACLADPAYDAASLEAFCAGLKAGPPPDGQQYLRSAFQHYYRALYETDPKTRAELLFFANLEIGFHEQTRLQPEINEALSAPILPPGGLTRNLLNALLPGRGWLSSALFAFLRLVGRLTAFDRAVEAYVTLKQRLAQRLITDTMMTIAIPPDLILRLGADLPAGFPPLLQSIADPALDAFLHQIEPDPGSTSGSGARFWGDLDDRMRFIEDLFRCYALSPALQNPPFTPEQIAAFRAGRLPPGAD